MTAGKDRPFPPEAIPAQLRDLAALHHLSAGQVAAHYLFTPEQVAALWQVRVRDINALIRAGALPHISIRGSYRLHSACLTQWRENNTLKARLA